MRWPFRPTRPVKFLTVLGWVLALAGPLQAQGPDGAASAAAAAAPATPPSAAAPTHRPLRSNRPPGLPEPTEPEHFTGYAGAAPFTVVARKDQLTLYPCSMCHKVLPLNTQPRKLVAAPHPAALRHAGGRIWCLDCHLGTDRDWLHSINGTKIDFNESYQLCGQCHGARQRDWAFGAHGKRVAGWQGERQIYACTHCHDPHNPALAPRAPSKPPPLRAGLAPMTIDMHPAPKPWQPEARGTSHDKPARP
jgi:hypothetical protein